MNNKELKAIAIGKTITTHEYFNDHLESIPEFLELAEKEGKDAVLLVLCQKVMFLEALAFMHEELDLIIKEKNRDNIEEFLEYSQRDLLILTLDRYLQKSSKKAG